MQAGRDPETESPPRPTFALLQNDALLRALDLHSKVSVTDGSGVIIEVNDNFCRTTGYSREELLGRPHNIVNSGVQSSEFWGNMWHTIKRGEPWRGEICNRAKNGSLHWVDSIIAPFSVKPDGSVEKYISIRTDVTAAKLAEQRVRASEEFLDRTARIAGIGSWQFDLKTRSISWSAQMNRILEADLDYLPTLEEGLSFYTPESRPTIERAVFEAMHSGVGWDLELRMLTRRGRPIWARSVGSVECQERIPVRLVGTLQDITPGKETEKSLIYERDLMASLLESLPDQIYFKDGEGKFLRVNAAMARRHGLKTPAEAVGKTDAEYFPPAYARRMAEIERKIMESGDPVIESEQQALWPDRPPTWSLSTKMALYDRDDRIVGTFGISRDITTRKLIAAQLQATSARLAIATDSAGIGVWEYDPRRNVLHWDDWMYRIYGLTRSSDGPEPYATWANSIHPEDRGKCEAQLAAALRGGAEFDAEFRIVRPGGEIRYVKASSRARRSPDGNAESVTGVNIDVTDLTEARRKAESANRAKSQFLANMSHEIRTPMNAIIGLSYLLAQTALRSDQIELLSKIQVSSDSLRALINDVLDLTKIEAGELIVDSSAFSPATLLRELSEVLGPIAYAKGIDFAMEVPADLPIALRGDSTRLKQILTNLIANAIKFTDKGGVSVLVSRLEDTLATATLRFVVRDTGIGISAEAQSRLFAPFAQADASITRKFGGTGLGLSIVKSLANLLGGDVHLISTPGVGSEFTVELQFEFPPPDALAAAGNDSTHPSEQSLRNVRTLIVDDSDINLEVTKRILELHGAKVSLCHSGQEAVDRLREEPHAFEVVLMDVQMPILDGYEATRQIRVDLGLVGLPIIALTAGALSSERQRAAAAGMDDFIVKPIDARTLASRILPYAQKTRSHCVPQEDLIRPRPPVLAPWPEIDGIDSKDARVRLCGDVDLFRSSLTRLLDEFSQKFNISADPEALKECAARMHKLSGCAGTLGANSIQQLALQVRSACVAGDISHVKRLADLLADQLKRLSRSAAPVLEQARVDAASADLAAEKGLPLDARLEPHHLVGLIELTRQKSLAALERFAVVAPQLRRHLGKETFEILRAQMDSLRFSEATQGLAEIQASLSVSASLPSRVSRTLSNNIEIGNGFSKSTVPGTIIP